MKATKQLRYQNRYGSHPTYRQAMAQVKTNFTTTWHIQQKSDKLIKFFHHLSKPTDLEWIFMDGSYIKAHQHACNIANHHKQGIGKSVGGNTSKIHLMVDACGNPIKFIITGSQVYDVKVAPDLVKAQDLSKTTIICADKGYDSDELRWQIIKTNTLANIPKKSNSKTKDHLMDWYLYKIRYLVENSFADCKQFRAVATRYDKLLVCYQGTLALAFVFQWVKLL